MPVVYLSKRPHLTIELKGGVQLGNCYEASYWRVTSRLRLTLDTLRQLHTAGVLGYGQEFYVRSQCNGSEPVALFEETIPTDVDSHGEPTGKPALSWDGRLVSQPSTQEYYVYECEVRCDSSD